MAEKNGVYGVNVYELECGHRYYSGSDLCNGTSVPCSGCQVEGRRGWDSTAPADEYARQRIVRFIRFR